jgi:hypothetical protein
MKPIKFEEATKNLAKPASMTDEECNSTWVYSDGQQCISCWKMTWKERLKTLLYGKVWLGVVSGQSQPPVWVDPSKTVFIKEDEKEDRTV